MEEYLRYETMPPKITVITAVYNAEKYLKASIESILGQSFKDFEFIIIDDCSTDNSLQIMRSYQKKDNRIIVLHNEKNVYATISRNKGLRIARGKYIVIHDADDISLPNRLQFQYQFMEKNQSIFLMGTGIKYINEAYEVVYVPKVIIGENRLKRSLEQKNAISHPSTIFRNDRIHRYREKIYYSEDYDFYLTLLSDKKRLVNVKDPYVLYMLHADSVSYEHKIKQILFGLKAREFYHQRKKFGLDHYDHFNPDEILKIDLDKSTHPVVLSGNILRSFDGDNFQEAKLFAMRYFKNYGYVNRYMVYYLLACMPVFVVSGCRKIKDICLGFKRTK